ncbi:hypothetical protein [Actinomadura latina]|uniref:Uncharacterized protein n=1 Tax=Actinomadura latina TaxID=163603 RepID=A0A846ZAI4_9ACTN|nr:hypothetical protein [Actinomadura latina]NKZ07006.1 hypothetical protein [Actinomadura latina]
MGFLKRFSRSRAGGRGAGPGRKPTLRERRARRRTREAEARLLETEARIHHEADRIRRAT